MKNELDLDLGLIAGLTMSSAVAMSFTPPSEKIQRRHWKDQPQHPTKKRSKAKAARKARKINRRK